MESPPHSYRFGPETADRTELEPSKKPVSGWLWDSSESAVWEIPLQVWRFLLAFGFVNFVYCESYVLFGCRESVGKEKTRQENIYIYIEIVNIFHRLRYEKIENCTWLTLRDHSRKVLLRTMAVNFFPFIFSATKQIVRVLVVFLSVSVSPDLHFSSCRHFEIFFHWYGTRCGPKYSFSVFFILREHFFPWWRFD